MSSKKRDYALILKRALESWRAGVDPALIELPEKAVFPHLICAAPATARKSRVTGVLLGKPTPKFLRRGRSIRYRLNDVLDWLGDADSVRNTAEASLQSNRVVTTAMSAAPIESSRGSLLNQIAGPQVFANKQASID